MAAEDFGFFARELPSVFSFLGIGNGTSPGLHSPRFSMDEGQLGVGARYLAELARQLLLQQPGGAAVPPPAGGDGRGLVDNEL